MKKEITTLTPELATIAKNLSSDKINEVQEVLNIIDQIDSIKLPDLLGNDANNILIDVKKLLEKVKTLITDKASSL